MPQLEFSNDREPATWQVTYHASVLRPEQPALFTVLSHNEHREVLEGVGLSVPPNVAHEFVVDGTRAAWEAWLFGEPGAMRSALQQPYRTWTNESKRRPW